MKQGCGMKRMSTWSLVVLSVALALPIMAQQEEAPDEGGWIYDDGLRFRSDNGDFGLSVKGLFQARLTGENPALGDSGQSFDIPRTKIRLIADAFRHLEVTVQANLAEGSQTENNLLEDAFILYKKHGLAKVWIGQGKVQFGRQALTSSSDLQFVDRSIASTEFLPTGERNDNRDVGVALIGENRAKTYAYSVGIYNGNGINKDEKDNSDYMGVVRLVAMPFGEFPLTEVAVDRPRKPRVAVGVSAVSLTRGTAALEEKIRDTTAALEFAFAYAGLNMSAEFFTRSGTEPAVFPGDAVESDGWYFQGGYLFGNHFEVALRYSEILRELVDTDETEAGIALNYYIRDHDLKVQLDYRALDFEAPPSTPNIDNDIVRVQVQFAF